MLLDAEDELQMNPQGPRKPPQHPEDQRHVKERSSVFQDLDFDQFVSDELITYTESTLQQIDYDVLGDIFQRTVLQKFPGGVLPI